MRPVAAWGRGAQDQGADAAGLGLAKWSRAPSAGSGGHTSILSVPLPVHVTKQMPGRLSASRFPFLDPQWSNRAPHTVQILYVCDCAFSVNQQSPCRGPARAPADFGILAGP